MKKASANVWAKNASGHASDRRRRFSRTLLPTSSQCPREKQCGENRRAHQPQTEGHHHPVLKAVELVHHGVGDGVEGRDAHEGGGRQIGEGQGRHDGDPGRRGSWKTATPSGFYPGVPDGAVVLDVIGDGGVPGCAITVASGFGADRRPRSRQPSGSYRTPHAQTTTTPLPPGARPALETADSLAESITTRR